MQNRRWYEWLLTLTYIAMVGLCVGLNLTTGQKEGMANLIVNAVMFLIVGLIFLSCERNCFLPMNRIIEDLEEASEKIRNDAMNSHQFLWEPYNNSKVELFQEPRLRQQFQDYLFELNRIDNTEKAYYKCDIGDYINTGLVDSVMHRNILNQVAGVMTGLGILGTFIGLSLGLQHFSTGTTAEVTNSIAPLMDGIKVAFHTSIYGMVFSLVFNFTYKCKLEEAEDAVEEFLDVYKKYVLPDTTTDGINKFMELQQQQVTAVETMTDRVTENLNRIMDPQFEKLNGVITDFSHVATRNQTEALRSVTAAFLKEMDAAMGSTFTRLNTVLQRAEQAQRQNADLLEDLRAQSEEHRRDLSATRVYLQDLDRYRQSLSEASEVIDAQLEKQQILADETKRAIQEMNRTFAESFGQAEENLERTAEAAETIRDTVEIMQRSRARR
ncbi:MAG: MotA/TolQ/ExbB proton channel family protein [Stomatobaculum sp.]|nr:MotA/TolQ/ExbB proton channel family protein [Stomatobaculum sp.]MBR7057893.1 MotA/TolQ/ExbB proton channel family protein [Stomatobaculum sp.]